MFKMESTMKMLFWKKKFLRILLLMIGVLVILIFLEQNLLQIFVGNSQSFIRIHNISETRIQDTTSCLNTRTDPPFLICTYDSSQDIFVSESLQSSGLWEPKMTKLFREILKQTESVTVIDVGANIGYFSLFAAALGHYAVAIEPVERNVQKLAQAIHLNNFQGQITILKNALSNERREVHMSLPSDKNQGAARVLTDDEMFYSTKTLTSASIVLDDLTAFINTGDIIIKLDIEGHECRALEKSEFIFNTFRVSYVITEWSKMTSVKHRYGVACPPERIKRMSMMLAKRGFVPYGISHNTQLDPETSDRWRHGDVYWKHGIKKR